MFFLYLISTIYVGKCYCHGHWDQKWKKNKPLSVAKQSQSHVKAMQVREQKEIGIKERG